MLDPRMWESEDDYDWYCIDKLEYKIIANVSTQNHTIV
jgi:hypothetical protein